MDARRDSAPAGLAHASGPGAGAGTRTSSGSRSSCSTWTASRGRCSSHACGVSRRPGSRARSSLRTRIAPPGALCGWWCGPPGKCSRASGGPSDPCSSIGSPSQRTRTRRTARACGSPGPSRPDYLWLPCWPRTALRSTWTKRWRGVQIPDSEPAAPAVKPLRRSGGEWAALLANLGEGRRDVGMTEIAGVLFRKLDPMLAYQLLVSVRRTPWGPGITQGCSQGEQLSVDA